MSNQSHNTEFQLSSEPISAPLSAPQRINLHTIIPTQPQKTLSNRTKPTKPSSSQETTDRIFKTTSFTKIRPKPHNVSNFNHPSNHFRHHSQQNNAITTVQSSLTQDPNHDPRGFRRGMRRTFLTLYTSRS